jgi:hypothetical protein
MLEHQDARRHPLAFWTGQLLGWGICAAVSYATYLFQGKVGQAMFRGEPWRTAAIGATSAFGQGLLWSTLLREYYVRRLPALAATPARVKRAALATLAASAAWTGGQAALDVLLVRTGVLQFERTVAERIKALGGLSALGPLAAFVFVNLLFTLLLWNVAYWASRLVYERSWQQKRARALARRAREAQFQMLRYQLNPHFLFNALNSLRGLMAEDVARAQQLTIELADFLRYSLAESAEPFVPLARELEAVRAYVAVETVRFEEKLRVELAADDGALATPVPSFLLHPLVENAVKYGMQTSPLPLRVAVRVAARGDRVRVEVTNSGRWVDPGAGGGTGIGLRNVRERLRHAFPGRHQFLTEVRPGEVHVVLEVPRDRRGEAAEPPARRAAP